MAKYDGVYEINREGLKKTSQKLKQTRGSSYFRMKKAGEYRIRVLPPYQAAAECGRPGLIVYKHFNLPPNNSILECPRTWPDVYESCPVCDVIDELCTDEPVRYFASQNLYVNAMIRSFTPPGGEPEIMNQLVVFQGPKTFADWLIHKLDTDRHRNRLLDPEKGRDIFCIRKDGNKIDYDYELDEAPRPIVSKDGKPMVKAIQTLLNKRQDIDKRQQISEKRFREVQVAAKKLRKYLETGGRDTLEDTETSLERADLVDLIKAGRKLGVEFPGLGKGLSDEKLEGLVCAASDQWADVWSKLGRDYQDHLMILGITDEG